MHKIFKRTCCAIVLPIKSIVFHVLVAVAVVVCLRSLIKSIVFPCPRCRRRRGLLKVPIIDSLKTIMNLILRGDETFKIKTVD